jgi:7-cyano-7-deazaguanine synthase in queuosine biosynthesis
MLWQFKADKRAAVAITYDYGQPAVAQEIDAANRLAALAGVPHETHPLPRIARDGVVYQNRNMILIAHALSMSMARKLGGVVIGTNATDHTHFPDCRTRFLNLLSAVAEVCGGETKQTFLAPFMWTPKSEVVSLGRSLGVPLDICWSCYENGIEPCGRCLACETRKASESHRDCSVVAPPTDTKKEP